MTSLTSFNPRDQEARDVIANNLQDTLFIEASAGTGKTTSLVNRVVNMISTRTATLDKIAAITFTEAAAAELRERIREELEKAAADCERSPDERDRCQQGISDLDQSAIQTLHAFAALLLRERPLEAGLPPSFEVSDEMKSGVRFNEEWDKWLDGALENPYLAQHISRALTLGLTLDKLKDIARAFHNNYDDIASTLFESEPPTPQAAQSLIDARSSLEHLCTLSQNGPGDKLYDHVQGKLGAIRRLEDGEPGSNLSYRLLKRLLPLKCGSGRQGDWNTDPVTGENGCKSLKELLKLLDEKVNAEITRTRRAALMPILEALRKYVIDYAEKRRTEGRAEFQDLLVWARDLLRDNMEVRDHFRKRFSHLLIDEVQDTDPLQAEIAMFLAEAVPHGPSPTPRPDSWLDVTPENGKLFVVGDPKQSIYRFRRADVEQMNQLRERMEAAGGSALSLVQNFRSHRPIVAWVNHLFSQLMDGDETQARYEEMHHRWEADNTDPFHPRVWALSDVETKDNMSVVRNQEAEDIADLLSQMVAQKWKVLDKEKSDKSENASYRCVGYSDICILMPTRTGLANLERGLEAGNIPYRLENASLIFETQEVRDLLNCLKAIDDPANQIAVVGALRSTVFGCSDIDLLLYHEAHGSFDYSRAPENTPSGLIPDALAVLRTYHNSRMWESPGSLIDRFIRDRGLMESALDHLRSREQWRRYRFMVEQAWRFAEGGGNSLRAFVEWIEDQINERVRVTESPIPDSDEEAVRIMTIHGAKGLEFPVVVLTGINSSGRRQSDTVIFDRIRKQVEVGLGSKEDRISTPGYEELSEKEKKMSDAEAVRLMYVAATRARDHLILSLRRKETGSRSTSNTFAFTISETMQGSDLWEPVHLVDMDECQGSISDSTSQDPPNSIDHSIEARDRWESERDNLIKRMGRPTYVSATSLGRHAQEQEDKPEQESDEPWRRGRAGTSVGRAVHAVLQSIDLATGADIEARSRVQAAAEGVPDRAKEVAGLVRVAVESDVVHRAVASGRVWREVPVATPTGDGILHGFIDLLFEEDDGLVIVDYKTDAVPAAETPEAVLRYRLQGGAYAHALQEITGKHVKEVVFLYLHPRREQRLSDLHQAIQDAEAAATAILAPVS